MAQYIDVHSHFNLPQFDEDRGKAIERMRDAGVATIAVGTGRETSEKAVQLAETYADIWAAVGQHPTDTSEQFDSAYYAPFLGERVVAVGECGLDYYRISEGDEGEKGRQRELFTAQAQFALEHDLPLMLHCRPSQDTMDAYEDILSVLESYSLNHGSILRGNVHFFVGSVAIAERFWNMGFTTSFSGVITFTHDYDSMVRNAPINMILSETDAPYVAPVPHRGKRNEPAYVREVVRHIAVLRNASEEGTADHIRNNARRVFGIE